MSDFEILRGDCRERLKDIPDASIDAVCTDPPYELGFMGKSWDASGIAYDVGMWREVLRVLKPGGHLVAFSASRTYHRMTCAIEDAGFEIRDSLQWLYGTGFPKSMDVAKAIDKNSVKDEDGQFVFVGGTSVPSEEVYRVTAFVRAARDAAGITNTQIDELFGFNGMSGHWVSSSSQPTVPRWEQWLRLKELLKFGDSFDEEVWRLNGNKGKPRQLSDRGGTAWDEAEVVKTHESAAPGQSWNANYGIRADLTPKVDKAAHTEAAKRWKGWGTALKPAHEPIVLARKPLAGTVAANVQLHGTGAINVDACRIGESGGTKAVGASPDSNNVYGKGMGGQAYEDAGGRWPANVILDEEAGKLLDAEARGDVSRFFYCAKAPTAEREAGLEHLPKKAAAEIVERAADSAGMNNPRAGAGRTSAGRANHHPTVKPISLMRWLCRLVAPPGGVVLDPFTGSGTTGCAALLEGFDFLGIEREEEYAVIAEARIAHWATKRAA